MDLEKLAELICLESFRDKVDLAGESYRGHLYRVAGAACGSVKQSENDPMYIIGLLHDILEDCPEWNEKSLRCLFPSSIIDAVVLLTKKKDMDYLNYIRKIRKSENQIAIKVKLADLEDNMNIKRLKVMSEKDLQRIQKYHNAYNILKGNME